MSIQADVTVADYLLIRLKQMGIDHIFGVPGDFVLGFLNEVLASEVAYVGTCNELNAAYAADGYARLKGAGAFVTTYAVGELSALNGVAGAFAERVPVVAITGAPSTAYFKTRALLHHTLGDYRIPSRMYAPITAASAILDDPKSAPGEIDRVLGVCLAEQRPVYLAIPADVVRMRCAAPGPFQQPPLPKSDEGTLREALDEAAAMLSAVGQPVVIGDVELIRYGLQDEFAGFLARTGLPYATMMLGKTVLDESHPQFIGLYQGDRSRDYVRERIQDADCVLELGALPTDFNTGGFTAKLAEDRTISANYRSVRIKRHIYPDVALGEFIVGLGDRLRKWDASTLNIKPATEGCTHRRTVSFVPEPDRLLTIRRFFDRVGHFLPSGAVVIAETGVALFSAAETLMPPGAKFIGQAFYGSIGYTVGATLGASLAAPDRKVVLFVGDGSFQVTCQDLSTLIRHGQKPIVFLLNNDGYTIERVIVDRPYNDIQPWKYHRLVDVFGGGLAFDVHTERQLEEALAKANNADELVFIEIHTERFDCSESLRRAGEAMARTNRLE
ncbi:MAG: alpha-keto acid decarboxylase family protein [Isosphaeraceae bacterium]